MKQPNLFNALEAQLRKTHITQNVIDLIQKNWESVKDQAPVGFNSEGQPYINPACLASIIYVGGVALVNTTAGDRRATIVTMSQYIAQRVTTQLEFSGDIKMIREELDAANPNGGIF